MNARRVDRTKHDRAIALVVGVLFIVVIIIAGLQLGWDSPTQPMDHARALERVR